MTVFICVPKDSSKRWVCRLVDAPVQTKIWRSPQIKERTALVAANDSKRVTRFSSVGYFSSRAPSALRCRHPQPSALLRHHSGQFATIAKPNIGLLRSPGVWPYLTTSLDLLYCQEPDNACRLRLIRSDGQPLLEMTSDERSRGLYGDTAKLKRV